jgi:predicted component of type VI protein secretion system
MAEGAVLLHVWLVEPAEESAAVGRLDELLARIAADPGFVSARVLQSADRASIAAIIEMRSVEDRERLERLPEVRETLDHLHGAANLIVRLYEQVKAYPT